MKKIKLGTRNKNLKYDFRETCFGLYRKDNQILVTIDKKRNQYSLIGGGIEESETKHDTLRREFLEEAGIKIPEARAEEVPQDEKALHGRGQESKEP